MGYIVKAGYVTVETSIGPGRARVDIPRGATLPEDVPAEDVDRLLRAGDIEADGDIELADDGPDGSGEVPDGTIAEVLAWVDGDPERAAQALEVEQAGKQRSTLIADLEQLTGDDE